MSAAAAAVPFQWLTLTSARPEANVPATPPWLTTLTPSCAVLALTAAPAMSTTSALTSAEPAEPVKFSGCVVPTLTPTVTPAAQVTACVLMVLTSTFCVSGTTACTCWLDSASGAVPSQSTRSTFGTPVTLTAGMVPPSHCVALALTTPEVKSSCPVPVPLDSSTLAPRSRAVCAVPLPVGPTLTVLASARPLASTTRVRPAVAGARTPVVGRV